MDKRMVYYRLVSITHGWPPVTRKRFSKNISKFGVVFFDQGAQEEREFQEHLRKYKLDVERKTIACVSGRDLYRYPFHYLSVQLDRQYSMDQIMDFESACGGDESVLCREGVKQRKKIVLDPSKSKLLDIMQMPMWLKPRLNVISRRLKELLESINPTGCDFVPCLTRGNEYSEEERDLKRPDVPNPESIDRFQLVVTAKTRGPCQAGRILGFSQRCRSCKTVYACRFERTPCFFREDLGETDFQRYDEYMTDEGEQFAIPGEIIIVSARVLRLLRENKVAGLSRYLDEPPVRHGVVEIEARP